MHTPEGSSLERASAQAAHETRRPRRFVLFTWKPWIFCFFPMLLIGGISAIRRTPELNRVVNGAILDLESSYGADLGSVHWLLASSVRRDAPSLFRAVNESDVYVFDKLLGSGITPNAVNQDGLSLLNYALLHGVPAFTEKLLAHSADANIKDASGASPLILSVKLGVIENIVRLLNAGADVNGKDERGMTPLMHAAALTDRLPFALLLSKKANLDARDNLGQTALFHAALAGKAGLVQLLLAEGVDTEIKNLDGKRVSELLPDGSEVAKLLPAPAPTVPAVSELPGESAPPAVDVAEAAREPEAEFAVPVKVKVLSGAPAATEEAKSTAETVPGSQFTRLRAVKQPEGVWQRAKLVSLASVSLEVRNVGSVDAREVLVQVRLPGGKLLPLDGPAVLKPNQTVIYKAEPMESVTADGKLKAQLSCQNCFP